MTAIMTVDKAHATVHSVYDSCEIALEKLNKLQNDEFFISMEYIFDIFEFYSLHH